MNLLWIIFSEKKNLLIQLCGPELRIIHGAPTLFLFKMSLFFRCRKREFIARRH